MNDASRAWYLRVREEFIKLGAQTSPYDPVLFYWHSNNLLNGLLSIRVDNISWRGTSSFQNIIIDPIKETFESSKESCSMFKYLGLFIQRKEDCKTIDQNDYSKSLDPLVLSEERLSEILPSSTG